MSRTKSATIQFFGNMVLMLLSMIQGLLLVPLYLGFVGSYWYGAWLALAGSMMLLGMADMGISSLVIQQSAVMHSRGDYLSLARLVGTMRLINLITIGVIWALAYFFVPYLPGWLNIPFPYHHTLSLVAWLSVIEISLMLLVNVSGSFLLGMQNPAPHMWASIGGSILSIAAIVVLLNLNYGILALSLGALARPLMILPVNTYQLYSALSNHQVLRKVSVEGGMFRDLIVKSLWLGPSKIAEVLSAQVDGILVARVLGAGSVTILSITRKVSDLSISVVGRISASLLSGLSHLHGAGEKDLQRNVIRTLFAIVIYAGVIAMGGYLIFNAEFVQLWVGPQNYGGTILTLLLFLYGLMKLLRGLVYSIVFSFGDIRISAKSTLVEVALQAILGFLFLKQMGLPGIVVGAIMGALCAILLQLPKVFSMQILSLSSSGTMLSKAVASMLVGLLPAMLLLKSETLQGWGRFISAAIVYLAFASVALYIQERVLFRDIWTSVVRRVSITTPAA